MFVDNGQMTNYSGYSQEDGGEILAQFMCAWDGANVQFNVNYTVETYLEKREQIESDFEEFKSIILARIGNGTLVADGEPK